jgi:hypothetical protein
VEIEEPVSRLHPVLRVPKQRGCTLSENTTSRVAALTSLAILLVTGPASGQMIPLEDLRTDWVEVFYQGQDHRDFQSHTPPTPFAYWQDECVGLAEAYEPCESPPPELCLIGQCRGGSWQVSEFLPGGIGLSGVNEADWGIPPSGLWNLGTISGFKFRVDHTFDYNLFIIVDEADSRFDGWSGGGVTLRALHSTGSTEIYSVENGQLQTTGRLGPGVYELRGISQKVGTLETYAGLAFSAQWTIQQPPQPHIAVQPSDHSTGCGGTVVFSVGTAGPQSSYTFQWRRNFVPLTNGPGITGATTSTLTLTNVCSADDYDVVVTGPDPVGGGSISEPSRLAHLTIVAVTGVENQSTDLTSPAIRAPAPNPFRVSTSVSYEVRGTARLVATVYQASGARIRILADRTVSGSGSVTWDGRLGSGARAPAGIYFVRVELDGLHRTRKVVLLD